MFSLYHSEIYLSTTLSAAVLYSYTRQLDRLPPPLLFSLIQQCIAQSGRHIAPAFPASGHNIGSIRERQDQFFGLDYIYKPHRGADNESGPYFPIPNQLVKADQRRRGISDGKDTGAGSHITAVARVLATALVDPAAAA